jgi:hypothetical protein
VCKACLPGKRQAREEQTSCDDCAAGSYRSDIDSTKTSCRICPRGWLSKNGSATCTVCPAGKAESGGSAACIECNKGSYQNLAGKTTCIKCKPGTFASTPGSISCIDCVPGKYAASDGTIKCDDCNDDEYQPKSTATNCIKVQKGHYRSGPTTEVICPAGKAGSGGSAACIECNEGSYQNLAGKTTCIECPMGWVNAGKGSTGCNAVPPGSYSWNGVVRECDAGHYCTGKAANQTACKPGTFASTPGSISCIDCVPGKYAASNGTIKCDDCNVDEYQPKSTATNCIKVQKGHYRSGPTTEVICPAGKAGSGGSASCIECDEGSYQNLAGSTTCIDCPMGGTSEKGSTTCVREPCKAGEFEVSGECKQCPAGWKSEELDAPSCEQCELGTSTLRAGSAVCAQCDLGKYGSKIGECSDCATGTYQDGKGETSCKECPANTYLSETGKSSKADCLECEPEKTTGTITGSISEASCLCKKVDFYQSEMNQCIACPLGGNCTCKNGITMSEIVPLNGYWQPFVTSTIFSNCEKAYRGTNSKIKAKERCNNISHIRNQTFRRWMTCQENGNQSTEKKKTTFDDPDVQCTNGYRGHLCASCAVNFVKQGDDCIFCEGGSNVGAAVGGLILTCIIIFMIVVLILQRVHDSKSPPSNKYFGQLKILIMFLQIVSALPYSIDSVQWPENFKLLAMNLNFVNFEFMKLMDFTSCSLSLHPLNRFALHVSFFLLVILVVITASAASICIYTFCNKGNKIKKNRAVVVRRQGWAFRILVIALLLLYPGLGTRIFSIFRCAQIDGLPKNQLWFQHDVSLECYVPNTRHHVYWQIAIASIFLIILGTPFIITGLLFRNRRHLHDENSPKHDDINLKFGSLYMQYERNFWFFEIVVMTVKQIMTGALGTLKPGTPIQIGLAVLVTFLYLMVLLRFSPFQSDADDLLAFVSALATLFITMIGLFLKLDQGAEPQSFDPILMGDILIAITLFVIAATFLNLVLVKFQCWSYITSNLSPRSLSSVSPSGVFPIESKINSKQSHVVPKTLKRHMSKLTRRKSLDSTLIERAMVHNHVIKLEKLLTEEHSKSLEAIQARQLKANGRLLQRLKERKKRGGGRSLEIISAAPPTLEAKNCEIIRKLVKAKCEGKSKLQMIFSKLDKDHSGTLSKKEFLKLITIVIKRNDEAASVFTKEIFDAMWLDLCNNKNVIDHDRLSEWIFPQTGK